MDTSLELHRPTHEDEQGYLTVLDPETGNTTASVDVDDVTYSVVIPYGLDKEALLSDRSRSSRTTDLESLMGGSLERAALINRAVLLVAFDAFEAGELPASAWQKFRVGVTVAHTALRQANRTSWPEGVIRSS